MKYQNMLQNRQHHVVNQSLVKNTVCCEIFTMFLIAVIVRSVEKCSQCFYLRSPQAISHRALLQYALSGNLFAFQAGKLPHLICLGTCISKVSYAPRKVFRDDDLKGKQS